MIPYTKLKDHERKNLREVLPLARPFTLVVEPTSRCNFKCVQCFQSVPDKSYFTENRVHMSMERFRKVIDQLRSWPGPRLKVLKLSLYGEPLLNPDFCDMLEAAKAADVAERTETTTNASLLSAEVCERLVGIGLDYMRVSVYSSLPDRHQAITQTQTSVASIRANLLLLKETKRRLGSGKPFVSVKMLDTFGDENDTFLAEYREVGDEVYLDKPHNWVTYAGKDFIHELYGSDANRVVQDIGVGRSNRIACTQPFFTLAVRSNGDVGPCCIDWLGETNIGNIDRETLRQIWEGDVLYEFRKMHLEGRRGENTSCRNCEFPLNDYYTRDNVDGFPVERLRPSR